MSNICVKGQGCMQQVIISVQISTHQRDDSLMEENLIHAGPVEHQLWKLLLLSILSHFLKQLWYLPSTCTVVYYFT